MSKLERQHRLRGLRVPPSLLAALAVAAVAAVVAAAALGYSAGRRTLPVAAADPAGFTPASSTDGLVELLARVDASATPDGGVRGLTYPRELVGDVVSALPTAPVPEEQGVSVEVDGEGHVVELLPAVDPPPPGRWTVTVASVPDLARAEALRDQLVAAELAGWVIAEQLDGAPRYRVSVGGWGSRTEAEAALKRLGEQAQVGEQEPLVTRY